MLADSLPVGSSVKEFGNCFLREEAFGATLYNPRNDEFYLVDPAGISWLYSKASEWLDVAQELIKRSVTVHLSATGVATAYGPKFIGDWSNITHEQSLNKPVIYAPRLPLLFNWLVTGNCPFRCRYCFAQDIMRKSGKQISQQALFKICSDILDTDALVVVLTGGEPTTCPYLSDIIDCLGHRKAIVVDTSGHGIERLIPVLKESHAHVRVSLDSCRPQDNDKWRTAKNKHESAIQTALLAIDACVSNGVNISVQTVLTSGNHKLSTLEHMRDVCRRRC